MVSVTVSHQRGPSASPITGKLFFLWLIIIFLSISYHTNHKLAGLLFRFRWSFVTTWWLTCLASSSARPRWSNCHRRRPGRVSSEADSQPWSSDWGYCFDFLPICCLEHGFYHWANLMFRFRTCCVCTRTSSARSSSTKSWARCLWTVNLRLCSAHRNILCPLPLLPSWLW